MIWAETLGTWLLVTVILYVKYAPNRKAETPHLVGMFVGGSLILLIKLAGWISGAAFNSAVGFALVILDPKFYDLESRDHQFNNLMYYLSFCMLAGVFSFVWLRFLHLPVLKGIVEENGD